jgi:hypothetical protein
MNRQTDAGVAGCSTRTGSASNESRRNETESAVPSGVAHGPDSGVDHGPDEVWTIATSAAPPSRPREAKWHCNDATGRVPATNGTTLDSVVALAHEKVRRDKRDNLQSLKRSGIFKSSDRDGKQPRLGAASTEEISVLDSIAFPFPALDPIKPEVPVSLVCSRAASSSASPPVVATPTSAGVQTLPSDDSESLGGESLLHFVLQSSKTFKDEQSMLLKKCQELVSKLDDLNGQHMSLFKEMKQADAFMKSDPPKVSSDVADKVSRLVARASIDEHHGNCADKAMKMHNSLSVDLRRTFRLHQKLANIVKLKELELASQSKAFTAWKCSREAWQTKSDELSREKAKLVDQLARVLQAVSDHNRAAPSLLLP